MTSDEMTTFPQQGLDEAAVAHVLAGDTASFEQIMRRHNQRLFRLTRAILGNDAEAEDGEEREGATGVGECEDGVHRWLSRCGKDAR